MTEIIVELQYFDKNNEKKEERISIIHKSFFDLDSTTPSPIGLFCKDILLFLELQFERKTGV